MVTPSLPARAWHPTNLLLVLALWLATVGNWPLWAALWKLPEMHGLRPLAGTAALVGVLLAFTVLFLSLLVWPRWIKPVGLLLLASVATSSYFMAAYGVVIAPTMLSNVVHTDAREVRDLLTWSLAGALLIGLVLPGAWWWRQPVRAVGAKAVAKRQFGVALLSVLVVAVLLWCSFQDLASLMRNYKPLRYMINPFNTLYAVGKVSLGSAAHAQAPLQPIGEDARLDPVAPTGADAPLIVLVVGETARAANFGLGGYARDTTPELRKLQQQGNLVYFPQVHSCGTNTQTSVPCMFSHLDKAHFEGNDARYEGLMDVLQHAGLAVLWLDNQSGCKGACDRVPSYETSALKVDGLCPDGECFDDIMLHELPAQLDQLDAQRRARGTVVVMHQMGSHGPAYYKRSPADRKPFQPECTSRALQDCDAQAMVNAYDNSIHYTDHFLAQAVAWLQQQKRPTALLYVSDHGESLGEKGLYLHGMPYRMAPEEQTHVPMVAWFSPAMQASLHLSPACLRQTAAQPYTHDNIFHTMLGLARVQTQLHEPGLDMLVSCTAQR
ncbi:MAG TPA: phosphoethanolamine--lipid A transferase [Macromonas sp.]|nr:phosphoethanolamine--lipid A transferase [Macromonas sp.]